MKKFISLLLTAALLASALAACSSDNAQNSSTTPTPDSNTSPASEQKPEEASIVYPVEIENNWGDGVTVIEKEPNAIAVFEVGMLDILDTLGYADRVVAVTHGVTFPEYLSGYMGDRYVNLGGFKDWDEEALIDSNPDLILAGFRQTKSIDTVTAIAPTLYFGETSEDSGDSHIAALEQRVNAVTALFGEAEEAEQYLSEINEKAAKIKEYTKDTEISFIIATAENGGITIGGIGSSSALLVNDLGLVNLYEDTGEGGGKGGQGGGPGGAGGGRGQGDAAEAGRGQGDAAEAGRGQGDAAEAGRGQGDAAEAGRGQGGAAKEAEEPEEDNSAATAETAAYIIKKNPTYLFVFDKDAAELEDGQPSAREIIAGAGLESADAYQNDHIVYLDDAVWYSASGGLKSTVEQLDTLIELFGLN